MRFINAILLLLAICSHLPGKTTHIDDLIVHDPCILPDPVTKTYYIYRSFSPRRYGNEDQPAGIQVFTSTDLVHWEGPETVFEIPEGFWADRDSNPWAPEGHYYKGRYYIFTTFNAWKEQLDERPGRPFINKRASQVLVSDSPMGPFRPFANKPHTPAGEMTLDASLFVDDEGQPWMLYCHEWVQLGNGLVKAIRLKDDLSETIGEPITLLNAGDLEWTKKNVNYRGTRYPGAVTDGCYMYRTWNGTLVLLWSSWSKERQYVQTIARAPSGKVEGPWLIHEEPLLWDDRGHGMVFRDFDGRLLLSLHRYFHQPATRVQIWQVGDTGDSIIVGKQLLGSE